MIGRVPQNPFKLINHIRNRFGPYGGLPGPPRGLWWDYTFMGGCGGFYELLGFLWVSFVFIKSLCFVYILRANNAT